ncbi:MULTISPECIES: mechanosensitive ion channel family protein [unclassified Gemella]|uniref:mechanosensitive ion channel family protein n=1 Tax=unclassified Gemella TaxID=2624949 RepID=UPI001C058574|nr:MULTISPECIES: mechanosensitive ion channel domain-containing protein [unclassified Gemella]MBU0278414.1 mechanosensitive ion channel family protein [Gemella sp. zg-1178]QWQ38973.1 mechanosensitive ion channel family protein [Gemella sp. zg-570]
MEVLKNKFLNIITDENLYKILLEKILLIILIAVIASLTTKIILKISDYIMLTSLKTNEKFGIKANIKRTDTLHKLINNLIKYLIYFIASIQILSVFGINTTGILASAGIVSVAIGFGAQSLVKDVITGFFLILEGQFDVGDYVKINNQSAFIAEGSVLALGLRSTKILANSGEIYFIPNSSINQVINYSQTYNLATAEFSILITESLEKLEMEINSLLDSLNSSDNYNKYFYKKEKIILTAITKIEDNIASIKVGVKVKLNKSSLVETKLRKDFYNKFQGRLKG